MMFIEGGKAYVKVANDGPSAFEGKCTVSLAGFDGTLEKLESFDVKVESMEVCQVFELDLSEIVVNACYLCASVSDLEETLLLCRPKDAKLLDPDLSFDVYESEDGKGYEVKVETQNPAFYIVLDASDIRGVFSDNDFSLNGKRTIGFRCYEDIGLDELRSKLKVHDLYSSCVRTEE